MELYVLSDFREIENPKLSKIGDQCISTLKKEHLIAECEKLGFDVVNLCRLGDIEPKTKNLVRLLQHALDRAKEEPSRGLKRPDATENPISKKLKGYDALLGRIVELEGKLKEKTEDDAKNDFERMKRETKEAASTGVKADELFAKLIILDSMARKINDGQKEQISMLVSRFQAHKDQPKFASALVLKLLSSKGEEIVLEQEAKMMKSFGLGLKKGDSKSHEKTENDKIPVSPPSPMPPMQWQFPGWQGYPMYHPMTPPRGTTSPSQFRARSRFPVKIVCFKCNKVGHMVKDCPYNNGN